jgi:arylsulfatase A-like enzyme
VILIVFDALRADHLGCYGYARQTSPRIDAFARTATLYTRAFSSSPWTVPTHASLFTGKPPLLHGARTFRVERPRSNVNPLHQDQHTLAEALQGDGYRTGAFVANRAYLAERWQLNQGFETYHVEQAYADRVNQLVFEWLAADHARPFFLFINYMDTHRPYNARPRPGLLAAPPVNDGGKLLNELVRRVMPGTDPVPTELAQKVIDQYDTAIAHVDEQVGHLLDHLSQTGLDRNTVVVLTSDHGEYFGEHHLVEHGKDVYQEALWVPLLVRGPGQREAEVDDRIVTSEDVPHLILRRFPEADRRRHAEAFPAAPGNHAPIVENYFARHKDLFHPVWGRRFWRVRRSVFDWPFKYIASTDGRHELYNLENDPLESKNLIDNHPEVARRLAAQLRGFLQQQRQPIDPDLQTLDEEERERLRSLGYLGE